MVVELLYSQVVRSRGMYEFTGWQYYPDFMQALLIYFI
jgi:hypothetical protein